MSITDDPIFRTFRQEAKYADYELQVNNEFTFKLHKDIIQKRSQYFAAMFNDNGLQSSNIVEIQNQYISLEQHHFDVVFDYLYGKQLKLNEYNYTDLYCIYTVAEFLVVEELTQQIQNFITTQLNEGMNIYDEINDNFDQFLQRIIFYYLLLSNTQSKRYVYTLLSACKNVVNEITPQANDKMSKYIAFNKAMRKILDPITYLEFAGNWRQNITLTNLVSNAEIGECLLLDIADYQDLKFMPGTPIVPRFAVPTLVRDSPLQMGDPIFRQPEQFRQDFVHDFAHGIPDLISEEAWNNIIISGGSITKFANYGLAEMATLPNSDVDIFVFGKSVEERQKICEYLVNDVFEANFPGQCRYTIKRSVMTVTIIDVPRQFQIICTSAGSGYQIVSSFDLTHVQFVYQNGKVLATPDAILSHYFMTTLIKKNSIFASRIYKTLKMGFKVIFPKTYTVFIWNGEKSEKFKIHELDKITMNYLAKCPNTKKELAKYFHPTSKMTEKEITLGLLDAFQIVPEQLTADPVEAMSKLEVRNNFVGNMMLNYGNTDNIMDYKNIKIQDIGFGPLNMDGKRRNYLNFAKLEYGGLHDGIRIASPLLPFPKHSFTSIANDFATHRLRKKYTLFPVFEDFDDNPEYTRFHNFITDLNNHVKKYMQTHYGEVLLLTPEKCDQMFVHPLKHRYMNMNDPSMKLTLTTQNYDAINCLFVDEYGNIICNQVEAFNQAKYMTAIMKVNKIWMSPFKFGYNFTVEKIVLHSGQTE